MAKILSDKEIEKLCEKQIISNVDKKQIRANSYSFRLGEEVRFVSTNERKTGNIGEILEINAGDSALIISCEVVDFGNEKVGELYNDCQLCAFITPTTTLIREGIQLLTTKIDPGYHGTLNWTIRNSGVEPIKLEFGEPIYKATFFLLIDEEELPEKLYGEREERDFYQNKFGLVDSVRRLPVDADRRKKICVSSQGTEFDRLKQSGFPYNFIATQLHQVGQDLDVVSKDFAKLDKSFKELEANFERQVKGIETKIEKVEQTLQKIEGETSSLDKKIGGLLKEVDSLVFAKLVNSGVIIVSVIVGIFGIFKYLFDYGRSELMAPVAIALSLVGFVIQRILNYIKGRKNNKG